MKNKKQIKNSNYIVLLSTISILLISGSIFYFNKLKINSNENYILGISDTLKGIEINFNDDKEEILLDISTKLNKDLCCNKVNFNLKINDSKYINVTTFKFCKKCVFHYHIFHCSSIFINRNNQILYNESLVELDFVKFKVFETLKKRNPIDNEYFKFRWDKTTSDTLIKKTLIEIQKGHLLYYENESKKIFNKPIKNLSLEELDSINKVKFNVYLNLSTIAPPSLPSNK
ncbi:MAG: hypothetical protein ACK4M1_00190 [Flavobacterium sp.]